MKTIKLMADYHCFPLWNSTQGEDYDNINPEDIPISRELCIKLLQWADSFDTILNVNDPRSSCFKTEIEEKQFIEEGHKLKKQLQNELGNTFEIRYKVLGSGIDEVI
jgi:hypothetical protein